jgi:hypothetical protein
MSKSYLEAAGTTLSSKLRPKLQPRSNLRTKMRLKRKIRCFLFRLGAEIKRLRIPSDLANRQLIDQPNHDVLNNNRIKIVFNGIQAEIGPSFSVLQALGTTSELAVSLTAVPMLR